MIDGKIGGFLMPGLQPKSIDRRLELVVSRFGVQEDAEKDHNRNGAYETNTRSFTVQKKYQGDDIGRSLFMTCNF